ncbi:MAG: TIGR02597 family protein [Prosthecobacter sp.]|uniref:TIGR02597 family protein n=1 Tax=Prosthecobacter sp. TaxID=1965333 RepID=UPI003BAE9FD9
MKTLRLSLLLLPLMATVSLAQVTTAPVGFNTVTALGNSDTRYSIPLQRPSVYQGLVQSVSGNVITVQGLPGWTSGQFLYVAGSQTNTYYVTPTSGNKMGMFYTITANAADNGTANTTTLTVDTAGDTLDDVSGIVTGDSLSIVPYWTLDTVFPGQVGITTTTSISGAGSMTRIFIPDPTSAGVDLAATISYYYYSGTGFGGAGWRRSGGGLTNKKNDDILSPDSYVIIRQDGVATNAAITVAGGVPTSARSYVIGTRAANTDQDNAIAVDVPIPLTLTQSNLFESGAFAGTTSISGASGDKLLVFDDTTAAIDKAAVKSYYYYTGTGFGGAGWRLQGGGLTTIRNNDVVFQPGAGYNIRKQGTGAVSTLIWRMPLTY